MRNWIFLMVVVNAFFSMQLISQTFTTPEVFSFKQEVFSPVSHFTGQANISIPLYTIQTKEINIPVNLSYIGGGGLRPINPYSSAGLGWKIVAGGAISRTVNGVPDENMMITSGLKLKGFFDLPVNSHNNSTVRNNVSSFMGYDSNGHPYFTEEHELSPDVFTFSFLGYSGYFVMGYDKEFIIQSEDIVKVERGNGYNNIDSWPKFEVTTFTLTANNGTKFTFGTTIGSLEISGVGENAPYKIDAWYLTKIECPNGSQIDFGYHANRNYDLHYKSSGTDNDFSVSYPVVLDEISYNGNKVVFSSSLNTHNISGISENLRLIDKIEAKNLDNETTHTVSLDYSAQISDRYHILNSIVINGMHYAFGYNNLRSLPSINNSFGTDLWGYYNGQPEITGPVRSGYRDQYLNQFLTVLEKQPSAYHAKIGVLTSIEKPTGVTERFEYEANTYSGAFRISYLGEYLSTAGAPVETGGIRISTITLGDQVVKYKYVQSFDPNNPDYNPDTTSPIAFASSGILYKLPSLDYWNGGMLNVLSSEGEPPVTYSKVIEFRPANKSYTVYNFTAGNTIADNSNTSSSSYYTMWASDNAIFNTISKSSFVNALGKNSSRSLERGKIKSIQFYDSANKIKKKISYIYNQDPNRYSQYVAGLNLRSSADPGLNSLSLELKLNYNLSSHFAFSFIHSYCVYTFPVYLEEEKVTEYYNGTPVTTITEYSYNNKNLKSEVKNYDSNGNCIETQFRYPFDINSGNYSLMVTKNMLNYPIEVLSFKNAKITGGKLTIYKYNSGSYVPDKEYSLEVTTPISPTAYTFFDGPNKDSRYGTVCDISYDSYHTNGNLKQTTGRDGIVTSYLWDASGAYPMSKVIGATYQQISSKDGKNCTYASNALWSELKTLAPASMISTYSYKSLRGITSQTNSNGISTYYTYDTSGRLFMVRDDDKNILSQYRYSYKNNPENGFGGYEPLSVSVSQPDYVTLGNGATASASVSGGSGKFYYNWYLKNSSGSVVSTNLKSTSSTYSFLCNQYGTYYIVCVVEDADLGISFTKNGYIFTCCSSIGSISLASGYVKISSNCFRMGENASCNISFKSRSGMKLNTPYLIGIISANCRPSSTQIFTVYSIGGRTWEISISSSGEMFWKLVSGTELLENSSVSSGDLTYPL